ncbi:MAG: HD domain-containing protein [Planctomycetes bacterium]|nr:HD domain-containing protein [Planctomycetota bacterium]
MALSRCPGQDRRFWKSEDVFDAPCPNCGKILEFWKIEPRRRCCGCGKSVLNPKLDLGCAKWCKHASDCLGFTEAGGTAESLADSIIQEMKNVFGSDKKRITHALEVLSYAEQILSGESADPLVVKASAILHDIGIQEAERKHGSAAGNYQELEGPPIARDILRKFQIDAERIEHICRIVGSHHSAKDIDTPEFRIIWDADRLANAAEECPSPDRAAAEAYIQRMFRTENGKSLAAHKLLGRDGEVQGASPL